MVNAEVANYNGTIYMYVISPTGSVVASNASGYGTVEIQAAALQTAGTYMLLVVPYSGASGTVTVSLTSNTTGPAMVFNTPASNAFSQSADAEVAYSFAGAAGQVVNAEVANYSGTIYMYVISPTGSVVASSASGYGTVEIHAAALQTAGTYTLLVVPYSGTSGTATISLTSNTTGPAIVFNTPASNAFSPSSDAEVAYSFAGAAGQVVNAEVANYSGTIYMYVISPTGSVVASNASGNGTVEIHAVALTTTGTYQLLLDPSSGTSGTATISLTSNTTNPAIPWFTSSSNALNPTASAEFGYRFRGVSGQTIGAATTGWSGTIYMYLISPSGSVVASNASGYGTVGFTSVALTSTGTYMLLLVPYSGTSGTAMTTLTAQNFIISGEIASGATVSLTGTQTSSATTDSNGMYSLSVAPGGDYTVTPSSGAAKFCPTSAIYNNLNDNETANFAAGGPTRDYIYFGSRIAAIENCGAQ